MNWFKSSSKIFLLIVPRWHYFCGSFVLFMSCVCHAFASVHCCLLVTCWERADLLALVYDVYCIFVTFSCGILGQVRYLIVSIPDLCHLSYFHAPRPVYFTQLVQQHFVEPYLGNHHNEICIQQNKVSLN